MDGPQRVIVDASTLINFLAADRADLLTGNRRYRFVITEHVRGEVTDFYPQQLALLQRLLAEQTLIEEPLTAIDELALFARMTAARPGAPKPLGDGEAASIAAAIQRDALLAIDDKTALKKALALKLDLRVVNTQHLVVEAIRDGRIDVAGADALKVQWERECRFRLTIASFGDLV